MDKISDRGGIQATSTRPDNLVWVEQVIIHNLENIYDPLLDSNSSTEHDEEHSSSSHNEDKRLSPARSPANMNIFQDPKIFVTEIDMRDEDVFGDDRFSPLSRLVVARIKYVIEGEDGDRNLFWVVKMPSMLSEERKIAQYFGAYEREICFYTEILPSIKMWVDSQQIDELVELSVPNCFYGKFLRSVDPDPDVDILDHILEAESLLVLDDLRAWGFGKRYFGRGMETNEVFAAVAEISKFHSVSHIMQVREKEPFRWQALMHWTNFAKHYELLFRRGIGLFRNFLRNLPNEPESERIMKAMNRLDVNIRHVLHSLMAPTTDFPTTLIHLDLWSDNLLFRVKDCDHEVRPIEEVDLECVIIDWQMVSLGKVSHDLALLVILSMDGEMRREVSHLVLQYYYQLFERTCEVFGVEMPFTYEALILEFSNSCLLAVIMAVASMDLVLLQESTQTRLLDVIKDLMEDGILSQE